MHVTRIVVAGLGAIGWRHAEHVAGHPGCRLVAVVDPARDWNDPAVPRFADVDAVDVAADALIVAVPTGLHGAVAAAGAARGWAILVEKPIAPDRSAAEAMIAACARVGVPLLVGHHRRHHQVVRKTRALLSSGAIGDVLGVSGLWCMKKPADYFETGWRQGAEGAPVNMNLSHDIDLLRFMLGEVTDVGGALSSRGRGRAMEDTGAVWLRFEGGVLGTFLFSDAAPSPWGFEAATGENPNIATTGQDVYRFIGTEGALAFPSLTLWRGGADWGTAARAETVEVPASVPLDAQLDHLREIIGGADPICSGQDALGTLEITQRIEALRPRA